MQDKQTLPSAADFEEEDWEQLKEKYTVRIGMSVWRGRKPTGQGRGVSVFNVEEPKQLIALIFKNPTRTRIQDFFRVLDVLYFLQ